MATASATVTALPSVTATASATVTAAPAGVATASATVTAAPAGTVTASATVTATLPVSWSYRRVGGSLVPTRRGKVFGGQVVWYSPPLP